MTQNTVATWQPLLAGLAKAETPQDIQKIRTAAEAASMLARKNHMHELALKCKMVELDAARKLGQWILDNVTPGHPHQEGFIGLPDIDKHESHKLRIVAMLPDDRYNAWINQQLADGRELTFGGVRRLAENWSKKHKDYSTIDTFDSLLSGIEHRLKMVIRYYPDRMDEVIKVFWKIVGGEWK